MADGARGQGKRAAEAAPTSADPIDIAMDAVAANPDDSPARRLLIDQRRLVGWQIAGERAGFVLKSLTALAAVALIAGFAALAWRAHNDKSLVIEAFETPPDLADKGLSGKVLATALQDRLTQMQTETVTPYQAKQVSNRWSGDIKVVIPQTGVSIGELDRTLRDWLGQRTRVSGEVFHAPDGQLALTVRAGDKAGVKQLRPEADIDGLVQAAAETIFRSTQPVRYGTWLQQHGRETEAIPLFKVLSETGDPKERSEATLRWALSANLSLEGTVELLRRAHKLDPESGAVATYLASMLTNLGLNQEGLILSREADTLIANDKRLSEQGRRYFHYVNLSNREIWLGAYLDSVADADHQREETSAEEWVVSNRMLDAGALAQAHDVTGGRKLMESLPRPQTERETERLAYDRSRVIAQARMATAMEDWPALVALTDEIARTMPKSNLGKLINAQALARSGRFNEADAEIADLSAGFYAPVIARAEIAALKGDWPAAERWYREAERLGPDLPDAQLSRGRRLLERGDAKAAAAALKLANQRSPRNADPLGYWGEALLAQGDAAGAIAKFTEAEKLAPKWGRLQMRWGQALAKQGKAEDAKARWAKAAALDLTPTEQAELAKLRGTR